MPNAMQCPHCQARWTADDPKLVILNSLECCVSVMTPVRTRCPNPLCGKEFVSQIGRVQVALVWPEAPATEQSRIVLPSLVMPKRVKG